MVNYVYFTTIKKFWFSIESMIIHTFSFQHFHWLFELIPIYPLYSFCHCFGCVTQGQLLSYALSQVPCLQSESEVKSLSPVQIFSSPWTVACQVPPSMGFSRQEYWSGLPLPSPGDLPDLGTETGSPTLQADALTSAKSEVINRPRDLCGVNVNVYRSLRAWV